MTTKEFLECCSIKKLNNLAWEYCEPGVRFDFFEVMEDEVRPCNEVIKEWFVEHLCKVVEIGDLIRDGFIESSDSDVRYQ